MTPTVTENPDQSRYEIRDEAGQYAGFTEYYLHGGVAAFIHTETEPGFEGRGLATTLVGQALDDVRRRGLTAEPFCSFVRAFIRKHPSYRDLVPASEWERFGLVEVDPTVDGGSAAPPPA